jgi:glycosyltransferase involved in cell wall biosynthesis
MPLVTITLPVRNAMPYLPAAVSSILGQTLKDCRIVILDDGSEDGSVEYLMTLSDPRLTVLRQPKAGLGTTLNRLLDICETVYFARMDADDVCHPARIERQVAYLQNHLSIAMLGTQKEFLFDGGTIRAWSAPLDHKAIHAQLRNGWFSMSHPTLVFRTSVAKRLGGYRIGAAGEDLDFLLRMCEAGRAANLPDVLYGYRLHAGSASMVQRHALDFGYAYARNCAEHRLLGMPEVTLQEFRDLWTARNRVCQLGERLDEWAESNYRAGLMNLACGRLLSGTALVCSAAVLRPGRTLDRVVRLATGADRPLRASRTGAR